MPHNHAVASFLQAKSRYAAHRNDAPMKMFNGKMQQGTN